MEATATEASLKWALGLKALKDQANSDIKHLRTEPLFHSLDWTPTCEDMVLLAAVDTGLQAISGCRGGVDAAVGTGKQAAPSNSVDTLTPECIEGLAHLLAPCGLSHKKNQEPVRRNTGQARRYIGT